MIGVTYFRYYHAGPQQVVELHDDGCEIEDVQASLDALRTLVRCSCCLPAFRGSVNLDAKD
jgi:hypothetical protein